MTVALPADPGIGIIFGLLSAACSSLTYLLSRHHALAQPPAARTEAALGLLVRSHFVMSLVAIPVAACIWPADMPAVERFIRPLAASAGLYFSGNILLFGLLRQFEASRLTPFLGLKVFILAFIVAVLLGRPLAMQQWIAVTLSVAATALLQGSTGALPARALVRVLGVCVCFALSDLFIVSLIDALDTGTSRFTASVLGMLLTYAACGLACGAALLAGRPRTPHVPAGPAWKAAVSYSVVWLAAMACLYLSFGFVGAVFGNVVQSTRGIMSVVIGAALAHLGWHELEQRVDRATLLRRIGAACLMTAAIAAYVL